MARMLTLDPAPCADLGDGWTLLVPEAGRYGDGLRAGVHVHNGIPQHADTVALTSASGRNTFAQKVVELTRLDPELVGQKLLELLAGVESLIRECEAPVGQRWSQATQLVQLVAEADIELFHYADSAYAAIPNNGHIETYRIRSQNFRRWLQREYYKQEETSPGSQGVQDALGVLEGQALFDGPEIPVYIRIAEHGGAIYVDLGDDQWRVVRVDKDGWMVVEHSPVRFWRSRGMEALPIPLRGGTLDELKPFVNLNFSSQDDWILFVSWLLMSFRPSGPYPILSIHGEQGSAKSTISRVVRMLIDPNVAGLRSTPRNEQDLVIAATNGWLLGFDNLSHLQPWLSDALCRLATGAGFGTRQLYTDDEETIFRVQRPIVMNGIGEIAVRPDLLDRAILLHAPNIEKKKRRSEKELWAAFEQARPRIFGALLSAVSAGLKALSSVCLESSPRMADFAMWACAVSQACGWTQDNFLKAYGGNREDASSLALEASPVARGLQKLMETHDSKTWEGTMTELHDTLSETVGESVTRRKDWPKAPNALSTAIKRVAPNLRTAGIDVNSQRSNIATQVTITRLPDRDQVEI